MVHLKNHRKFTGIWTLGYGKKKNIYTRSLDPGNTIYGEKTVLLNDDPKQEYREWNPYRSKLAAAIHNNCSNTYIHKDTKILYLGASTGTTVTHISDIIQDGLIYAVEFAHRSGRELAINCFHRPNVIPILADANHPYEYSKFIISEIDLVYQDISQKNQTEILLQNVEYYLKPGGIIIFAVKSRSIDTFKSTKQVFEEQMQILRKNRIEILETRNLEPYTKDHLFIFGKYAG